MGMKKKNKKKGNNNRNNGKKAAIVGVGVILLIAFYNGIGYAGNAIADTQHSTMWWTISGIVAMSAFIVESIKLREVRE